MKITISAIKADIGSIGGHLSPSRKLIEAVTESVKNNNAILDYRIFYTGDDITILMSHQKGLNSSEIHKIAWDAFQNGTVVAKEQGLYGAGQDLLKDSFSGNVKGLGPAAAEMEFEERPAEPFLLFMADKTSPGAYNLPFYLSFIDPFHNSGLILVPEISQGYRFVIMDMGFKGEGDRVIELETPNNIYDIACLLRDTERFGISEIYSKSGDQCVSVSTTRLHNIAGVYTGKDDPIALVRVQKNFPATGEILSPYSISHYVAGFMRGSHIGPLMPVKVNTMVSYFDGPPLVSGVALCVQNGKFTEHIDVFDHPFWDSIRAKASAKAEEIRRQGFFGNAMLGMDELEYTGIVKKIEGLNNKFIIKQEKK
ncbi:fructose-1,6-bisphosphatase [Patescibacteria group bacterium]|nr:fructose-1,6-bisphosphatase [Patescibacteria group bacterium]MBU4162366.1 fructose-1,6-bisphosphatase [Patescibacteria group bacterium]